MVRHGLPFPIRTRQDERNKGEGRFFLVVHHDKLEGWGDGMDSNPPSLSSRCQ